jgi:hypothetical protein
MTFLSRVWQNSNHDFCEKKHHRNRKDRNPEDSCKNYQPRAVPVETRVTMPAMAAAAGAVAAEAVAAAVPVETAVTMPVLVVPVMVAAVETVASAVPMATAAPLDEADKFEARHRAYCLESKLPPLHPPLIPPLPPPQSIDRPPRPSTDCPCPSVDRPHPVRKEPWPPPFPPCPPLPLPLKISPTGTAAAVDKAVSAPKDVTNWDSSSGGQGGSGGIILHLFALLRIAYVRGWLVNPPTILVISLVMTLMDPFLQQLLIRQHHFSGHSSNGGEALNGDSHS